MNARTRPLLPRSGPGRVGAALLTIFILCAVFADVIAPHDPWERFGPFRPPERRHLLGTNDVGHDIFSELIHGARVSMLVGIGTGLCATLIGVLVGLLSGYFGGTVDEILMGVTDVMLMIPRIPLIIVLSAFLQPGYGLMVLVLGLLWWTTTARVVRSKVLQISECTFVEAQRTLGFGHGYIVMSDILPNVAHIIAPKFMLTVASAMIAESSLSFLGLGDAQVKSWGMMIRFAFERGGFIRGLWWWYAAPGTAISLCVLSLVLMSFSATEQSPEVTAVPE